MYVLFNCIVTVQCEFNKHSVNVSDIVLRLHAWSKSTEIQIVPVIVTVKELEPIVGFSLGLKFVQISNIKCDDITNIEISYEWYAPSAVDLFWYKWNLKFLQNGEWSSILFSIIFV